MTDLYKNEIQQLHSSRNDVINSKYLKYKGESTSKDNAVDTQVSFAEPHQT